MRSEDKREGFTLWFTGIPASGKTTLSMAVERELRRRGLRFVQRLDGDIVRQDLTRDLGFSKEDRDENIRRVAFVAISIARDVSSMSLENMGIEAGELSP